MKIFERKCTIRRCQLRSESCRRERVRREGEKKNQKFLISKLKSCQNLNVSSTFLSCLSRVYGIGIERTKNWLQHKDEKDLTVSKDRFFRFNVVDCVYHKLIPINVTTVYFSPLFFRPKKMVVTLLDDR